MVKNTGNILMSRRRSNRHGVEQLEPTKQEPASRGGSKTLAKLTRAPRRALGFGVSNKNTGVARTTGKPEEFPSPLQDLTRSGTATSTTTATTTESALEEEEEEAALCLSSSKNEEKDHVETENHENPLETTSIPTSKPPELVEFVMDATLTSSEEAPSPSSLDVDEEEEAGEEQDDGEDPVISAVEVQGTFAGNYNLDDISDDDDDEASLASANSSSSTWSAMRSDFVMGASCQMSSFSSTAVQPATTGPLLASPSSPENLRKEELPSRPLLSTLDIPCTLYRGAKNDKAQTESLGTKGEDSEDDDEDRQGAEEDDEDDNNDAAFPSNSAASTLESAVVSCSPSHYQRRRTTTTAGTARHDFNDDDDDDECDDNIDMLEDSMDDFPDGAMSCFWQHQ